MPFECKRCNYITQVFSLNTVRCFGFLENDNVVTIVDMADNGKPVYEYHIHQAPDTFLEKCFDHRQTKIIR